MKNFLLVTVKYISPTGYRGSRIKLTLPRFGESKAIPYDYDGRDAEEGAVRYLASKGIAPIARACGPDGSAMLLFDFEHVDALIAALGK
jgi:hypothetical protein